MSQGLQIKNLRVDYGATRALEDLCFDLAPNCLVALVGKNGSGKTTLLKAICGLVKPSTGSLTWNERPITTSRGRIAYLPQREAVDWNFPITVRGVVEMGRFPHVGWFRTFREEDEGHVDRALEQMKLSDIQHRQISELSGGQQQRTFIARALAQEAEVMLLDEAFNGLDYPSQKNLAGILRSVAEEGRLILISHHDLETLTDYFDEAVILNQQLVHSGIIDEATLPSLLKEADLHG